VEAIDELRQLSDLPDEIRLGAALSLAEIALGWSGAPRAWREWTALFASPPIRNRATLGGNLATASPIGDAAPLLLALDASVELAGTSGRRRVPLASFFTGYRKTVMTAGELLVSVHIPKPLPPVLTFYKVAKRRFDDISTVAAAMAFGIGDDGRMVRARVAYGGVAATPIRVGTAERALEGQHLSERTLSKAKDEVGRALAPMSDHRGSKEYRLQVAMSLLDKFRTEVPA
jgi:xanthine dehydrogenase small subunit